MIAGDPARRSGTTGARRGGAMKVFVSFDMEGIAGIVDWRQCIGDGPAYQLGQHLTLGEVNAAIDGAVEAGADEVVVNDAHWTMHNLPPHELHGRAAYVAGRHKPLYMMQGMDSSFDACLFVGYHGSISGEGAVLSHTYNPAAISHAELNGTRVGESGINALVARAAGVPVALVSGDRQTAEEAKAFLPGAELVVVKESFTRFAAQSLHPERARQLLREGARRALRRAGSLAPPAVDLPARLEVWLQTADMAEMATWVRGVERSGLRSVMIEGDDPLALYRSFVAVVYLTRVAEGR
jgi:D-amino peptidase